MMRNVVLKKVLKGTVFKIFNIVNFILPKFEDNILLYSPNKGIPENINLFRLREYLIKNQYNHKYKIICGVQSEKYKDPANINGVQNVTFSTPIKSVLWFLLTKNVFYTAGQIPIKPSKKQVVVNMWHGIPLKTIGKLSNINNGEEFFFSYVCAPSEFYRPIMAKAFGCPEENVCICGEPKADQLFIGEKKCQTEKVIVWAPTFRQSAYLGYDDSTMNSLLPLIKDDEWEQLNDILKEKGAKVIVKLHGAQDLYGFTEALYSNLEIYSEEYFLRHGYELFQMLSQADALLSDYSSVYLEYLVLDRPIGFTINDIQEYQDTRGFVFDNPINYMPGEKIYIKEDLFRFIDNVINGIDEYSSERKRVCELVHQYRDGRNCERLLQIAGITK